MRGVFGEDIRKLCVGDIAPDFDVPVLLKGVKGRFRLSDWVAKHKYLLIVFYPLNWEDLSAGRVVELQAQREKYVSLSAECVTVSVDSIMNTTAWHISKTAAGFAAGAVLMLVLGAWMFRKGPVPAEMGATAEDAHQAAPFTDNRTKPATPSPSALGSATPGVPERSETYSSGIVPQAAAAITPIPSPKKVTTPKRAPVKSGPSDDIVARDTVTRFAAHTVKSPPKPKSKPAKPTNDGIKRYSDLD